MTAPSPATWWLLAADTLLLVHALFVGFVVLGLSAIGTGKVLGWAWVRNPWFRWLHLAAIVTVVVQAWLGWVCPLTTWEMAMRERAGDSVYAGTFMSHWLTKLLYYQLPDWVFVLGYSLFGTLVISCWFWVRPRRFGRQP